MTWKQKVIPDVNVPGYSGGCLAYVDDGVNPPKRQPTAQVSWQYAVDTKVAHPGEEPPTGVWVPVYYSINNGPWAGYGHVAWFYSDGNNTVIYDSEFGCDNRTGPYSGGGDLFNYMGWQMSYLGWSEMVDGLRIVENVADNNSGSNPQPQKGEIEMYLIYTIDKKNWYVSNGVQCKWVKTERMLKNYQNEFGKLNLRVDKMYSTELYKEFPQNTIIK
ncbi:hypothetical protein ACFSJM_10545 [Lactococcus formosensis subsp. bovis]|uniref:hypothetical protein n=1 Tax=Lactococcus formosensis TaxID=1281486 RepID=UPI001BD058D6|nr:hypothetical protein [Lactococcus formosensis]